MRKTIFTSVTLFLFSFTAFSQKWAVETNALDWANYGTANLSASRGINRYCAAVAGVRFNPWKFKDSEGASHQNRALTANLGVCFWPWHIYSGWWLSGAVKYQEYNAYSSMPFSEGDKVGASVSVAGVVGTGVTVQPASSRTPNAAAKGRMFFILKKWLMILALKLQCNTLIHIQKS